jgi:hypothetical protein
MSSEFTKEEDYREVRKNPETYWQFERLYPVVHDGLSAAVGLPYAP